MSDEPGKPEEPASPEPGKRPNDPIVRLNRDRSEWRGELADPEVAERLEQTSPIAFLKRREFLARTAALAGAAGMASILPIDRLVSEAAKKEVAKPYPSPRNMPIDTFVVLMMENRSFDHYFGWHPDADARNEGLSYPDAEGNPTPTHHLGTDFQGCDFRDPEHGWDGGRWQYDDGKLDGFVQGNEEGDGSDSYAAGYYEKEDIPFIPHAADAYQLYDRYFCSIMASTYPNRHYMLGAQNGGQKSNKLPPETKETTGFSWETIFDRAKKRGVSFAYYVSDLPVPALYGARGLATVRPVAQFYADAAAGQLPQICYVDPPFRDGGGGNGLSADEHPHGDIRLGQAFMSDIVHAWMESPQYKRGAMFVNYDEWGGFFDHVKPPHVPDDRYNRKDLANDWSLCGFRVPGVAISPFTKSGGVSHMTVTHESILKLIAYRFGMGYLNTRHAYASDIGRSFNFDNPDPEPASLPDPTAIVSTPCAVGGAGAQGKDARRPEPHHLSQLETSGLLDRLGYEVQPATVDRIFRSPDSIRKGLSAAG